jgi:hypothetical protein
LLYKLDLIGCDIPVVAQAKKQLSLSEESPLCRPVFRAAMKTIVNALYSYNDKTASVKEFELLVNLFKVEDGLRPKGVDAAVLEPFLLSRGLTELYPRVQKKAQQGKTNWLREDFQDLFEFYLAPAHAGQGGARAVNPLPKIIYQEEEPGPVYHAQREHQPPGPYPSIQTLMDSKDYKVLVQKLFERDEGAFRLFIEKVDQVDKWREAKQLIDRELNTRRLDPYCKEAVKLGDIVFSKYFSNSGYL